MKKYIIYTLLIATGLTSGVGFNKAYATITDPRLYSSSDGELMAVCNDGKVSYNGPDQKGEMQGRCSYHGGIKYNCITSSRLCTNYLNNKDNRPNQDKYNSVEKRALNHKKSLKTLKTGNDGYKATLISSGLITAGGALIVASNKRYRKGK